MTARLIKRAVSLHSRGYSAAVRARLDPQRPKYTEAVKALAAFAPDERKFVVLVAHLDAACKEMHLIPRPGRLQRLIKLK